MNFSCNSLAGNCLINSVTLQNIPYLWFFGLLPGQNLALLIASSISLAMCCSSGTSSGYSGELPFTFSFYLPLASSHIS
jgi:hypothetical protein